MVTVRPKELVIESRPWTKARNPVMLIVVHHHQNPSKSVIIMGRWRTKI